MFRARTVLVLGAGASVEVGLPTGDKLLQEIVDLTHLTFEWSRQKSGDPDVFEALKYSVKEDTALNAHLQAALQLRESAQQALSIDNVIDALEDEKISLIGKLGIVRAILNAEAQSSHFQKKNNTPNTFDITNFSNTWYGSLSKLLTEGIRRSQVETIFDNIEIVNFNYDRCLEYYLPVSLASYYGVNQDVIREAMQNLKMHRPYGVAGRLPWQKGDGPSVPFGESSPQQLPEIAKQIRTFTEQVEEGVELEAIRAAIANADRLIFLGFAFHRQNVRLMAQEMGDHAEIIATAYQVSRSDCSVIADELRRAFSINDHANYPRIQLADMTCAQFFEEYWRTLTAEKGGRAR